MKKILGVNRNVFFLGLVSFFNDFSAEMVQSVMPIFLTAVLGAPAFLVGLLEGFADALASVLKLFSGWFSDKIGKRKLPAIVGYMLSTATRPFLAFTTVFGQVFALRAIDRVGKGFRDAPRDALIVESSDSKELGKSFGFHRSLDTLGATLGPLSAFFILPFLGNSYRSLFLVAFGVGVFAIVSFLFVTDREDLAIKGIANPAPLHKSKTDWSVFRKNKKFILVVAAIFVFGLGSLPIGLVLLKAKETGMSFAEIPLMYFVYSLAFVLTAVPLGKLADRIGEPLVIFGGFIIASIAYLGFAASSHIFAVTVFFITLGVFSAATDGLQRALAARYVPPEILATGQGFLNMAVGFSSLAAGLVGGILWTRYSSSAAFLYAAIVCFMGAILFYVLTTRRESQPSPQS